MKKLAILILLALALAVSGCSQSPAKNTITTTTSGNWEAQLTGGMPSAGQMNFVAAFNVTDTTGVPNESLDITGFSFINAGTCFANGTDASTENGSATLVTSSTGAVTGSLTFTVTSNSTSVIPAGNVLTLTTNSLNSLPAGGVSGTSNGTPTTTGTLSNGVVWGNWSLQSNDSSCLNGGSTTIYGNFIMCQGKASCTIP